MPCCSSSESNDADEEVTFMDIQDTIVSQPSKPPKQASDSTSAAATALAAPAAKFDSLCDGATIFVGPEYSEGCTVVRSLAPAADRIKFVKLGTELKEGIAEVVDGIVRFISDRDHWDKDESYIMLIQN